eukprot:XP_001706667.1 Hypothetical protein GL50803_8893 [Giardia lamblia ATCC 50803]
MYRYIDGIKPGDFIILSAEPSTEICRTMGCAARVLPATCAHAAYIHNSPRSF